ncbi:MAG: SpoIIE family protein phosphatase [Desulfobacterales bacterium]
MKIRISQWNLAAKLIVVNVSAILVLGAILSIVFISFRNIETLVSGIVKKEVPQVIENGQTGNELTGMFADLLMGMFYGEDERIKEKSEEIEQIIMAVQDVNPDLKKSLEEFRPKLAAVLYLFTVTGNTAEKFKMIEGDFIYTLETLQDKIAEQTEMQDNDSPAMRHMEQLKSMGTRYREVFLNIAQQVAELRGGNTPQSGRAEDHPVIADMNYLKLSLETLLAAESEISQLGRKLINIIQNYKETLILFLNAAAEFQKQIRETSEAKESVMTVLKDTNSQIAESALNTQNCIDERTGKTGKIILLLSAGVLVVSLLITYSVFKTFRIESDAKLLEHDMELAKKIQTALLPKSPEIQGYEIAASCDPADQVGGDYYDMISVGGYDWIVIGDVSGHGVTAGLVMMMVQTAIHTVLIQNPQVQTSQLLSVINQTIYENIVKMDEQKHMTILVIACGKDGFFDFSGLHEDILLWCAQTRKVETIETDGMWIGLEEDISGMLPVNEFRIGTGDCLILYTDGIIEARGKDGKFFGTERLTAVIEASGCKSASEIHAAILSSLRDFEKPDDVTLFVMKRV